MQNSSISTGLLYKRLQAFEFLQGLDDETILELARNAVWKIFAPDAVIFWEGDVESNLFFLQYGWLKVMRSGPDGREQVLRFLGPGEIFNELGVFARRPNPATAIALEEVGIWLIPRRALEEILFAHPQASLQIIANMADRFISLVDLTVDLSLRTVEARLAKLLLEQAQDDIIPRQRWLTLTELAARLGTVPDVLSRVVRELTRSGLIEMDKSHIRILDRARLSERAMLQNQ